MGGRHSPASGRCPLLCARLLGVGVCGFRDRRVLAEDHRWQTSTGLYTDLAQDALRMAVWQRKRQGAELTGLVHHSDRGVQYRSIRYGQAVSEAEAVASVGSKGDSFRLCPGRGSELLVQGRADP